MTHPGIELRVLFHGQPVVLTNSDMLHLVHTLWGHDVPKEQWTNIFQTVDGLMIEVRHADLPDPFPFDYELWAEVNAAPAAAEPVDQDAAELLDQLNKIPCWQCRLCKWTYQPGGSHFCPIAQRHLKEEDVADPSNGAERMKTVVLEELNEIFRDKLHANDFRAVHALLYDYAQQRH